MNLEERERQVFEYHQLSKHNFQFYAPGPGNLDWANQPNPFRKYGVEEIDLELVEDGDPLGYDSSLRMGQASLSTVSHRSVSQLFQDSLGLSAWKSYLDSTWALRINPSSGNLHPTEGYLISGKVGGISSTPIVAHYAPREHALEVRLKFSDALWNSLAKSFPEGTFFIALTSIHWREAWKYGERAFRYCHHDVGHAIGAIAVAASQLGWHVKLLDQPGTFELEALLGLDRHGGPEKEHADCLLAIAPSGQFENEITFPRSDIFHEFSKLPFDGTPNQLSPGHLHWEWVEKMEGLTVKPFQMLPPWEKFPLSVGLNIARESDPPLRGVIRSRRSAVAMDGHSWMELRTFYRLIDSVLPSRQRIPFQVLSWPPLVHFLLFVHRVKDLDAGFYFLVRNETDLNELKSSCHGEFTWEKPPHCPAEINFFCLRKGDAKGAARALSCGQDIAADGCFSLGMVTKFEQPIRTHGPWFYRQLYWECGLVGQVLYLESEAAGFRATGIGCFFDDPVHQVLGLKNLSYQSLYHFTVGVSVEDSRIQTLPPYDPSWRSKKGYGRD